MKINKKVKDLSPSGIRAFFDLVIGMKDVISLGVGEPDFDTPWRISESAIFSVEKGYTTYTSNKGLQELREQISRYLKPRLKTSYDPNDEILITVGVSEAMDLAMRALSVSDCKALIHEPCYVSYYPTAYLAGLDPVYLATTAQTAFKVTPKQLAETKTSSGDIFLLNYPCNPTGASYNRDELVELARVIEKKDLFVISDEIYGDYMTYDGDHVPFPSLPGMRQRTLYLNGFSKAYAMTGWRIGYAAGPREVIAAMTKIHQYTILCAPIMGQMAALEALRCDKEAKSMRAEYNRRRKYIVTELNKLGLDCLMPQGAFYAFASIQSTGMDSVEFAHKLLEEEKVAVVPGTAFGPSGAGYIRMSYATGISDIKEALSRIGKFLKKHCA
ncbi:MAG: aminotransferase class I/II-fold pyridoxal phosphate-dependent enzyme [Candidatus Theseobacter exili]|nr:aminotransferase class I/II-fold pyridoxal phosphate-dependent enzyme [Candidatus Theseobacter exili]